MTFVDHLLDGTVQGRVGLFAQPDLGHAALVIDRHRGAVLDGLCRRVDADGFGAGDNDPARSAVEELSQLGPAVGLYTVGVRVRRY